MFAHPTNLAAVVASRWRLVALPLLLAGAVAGCSSLTPIETLIAGRDAEPLLAQIRAGSVDVNQSLPWGGGLGIAPSYFTPLCAAALVADSPWLDEAQKARICAGNAQAFFGLQQAVAVGAIAAT